MNMKEQLAIQAMYDAKGEEPEAPKKRGRPPKKKSTLVAPEKAD